MPVITDNHFPASTLGDSNGAVVTKYYVNHKVKITWGIQNLQLRIRTKCQLSNTFNLIEESVKIISLPLSSFGWSRQFNLILMCSGFMKIRSLRSPVDCNKNAFHKSLSVFPHFLELKISSILAAYFSRLPSFESGTSLKYSTA